MSNRKASKANQTVKHLTPIKGESSVLFVPLTTAVISTVRKVTSQAAALLNRSVKTGEKVEQWRTKAKVIALSRRNPTSRTDCEDLKAPAGFACEDRQRLLISFSAGIFSCQPGMI